jgi:hypothetical protein
MGTNLVNTHGCTACQVPRQLIVLTFPTISWSKPEVLCDNGRSRISCDHVPHWCCSCRPILSSRMSGQPQRCTSIPTPCAIGDDAGPMGRFAWTMSLGEGGRPGFPPLDQALVKAIACEAVHHTALPLRDCPEISQPRCEAFKPLFGDIGKKDKNAATAC